MMLIKIISVGKKNDVLFDKAIEFYCDRLKNFATVEWDYIKPSSLGLHKAPSIEAQHILAHISSNEPVWLLDETGMQMDSPALSGRLESLKDDGVSRLHIVIGGAYGVNELVKQKADIIWSLSLLTFPHQLVRLLLSEQLYRAFSISSGSKYHHGNS